MLEVVFGSIVQDFRKLYMIYFQDNEQYKDKTSVNCSVSALIDGISYYIWR